ncbi:ABC transporter substrate-binding protein [Dechloromonas denitrificans]|uniref:ABC transporter substrate-binding protein n=1 Tax=Dechloromonas denitrificans TaxID=281362 RepID=UPI001CF84847|nr:ABC transporter substrate-binding protein [Dechloromonas denitrificans]UCV10646.1 ABC transporter substrate-binding protein [Dechloromonas denitrificans]
MKMNWRALAGLLFSCLVLLPLSSARAQQGGTIKLGQSVPLTGALAELGTEYRDGALAYFNWVNSKGGVHGRRIELLAMDDAYVVERSLENARRLLDKDGVLAFFGMFGSANYAAVQPLVNERGVPSLAPYTGSDELRAQPSPTTFWLRASYGDESEKIIDQLTTLGIDRIAVFYQNDAFGKAGLAGVENALKKRGLKLRGSGVYDKTKNDVTEAVKAIAAVNPQAVVMISTYKPTAAFVKQMRQTGQVPQFFALSVVGFKALQAELGNEVVGVAISQVVPYPWSSTKPVVREFLALPKEFQPAAGATYTTLEGYLAAKVMVEALQRAGPQLNREKLLAALDGMRPYDSGGFTVNYNGKDRLGSRFVEVTIVGNGGRLMR